jgi:hypothetical protein
MDWSKSLWVIVPTLLGALVGVACTMLTTRSNLRKAQDEIRKLQFEVTKLSMEVLANIHQSERKVEAIARDIRGKFDAIYAAIGVDVPRLVQLREEQCSLITEQYLPEYKRLCELAIYRWTHQPERIYLEYSEVVPRHLAEVAEWLAILNHQRLLEEISRTALVITWDTLRRFADLTDQVPAEKRRACRQKMHACIQRIIDSGSSSQASTQSRTV